MGSLATKEKKECTHFYLSIFIESTKNVFGCAFTLEKQRWAYRKQRLSRMSIIIKISILENSKKS
jgi:hypothetical protein